MDEKSAQQLYKIAFEMEEALHYAQKYIKNPLITRMMREAQLKYLRWEKGKKSGADTGTIEE